MGYPVNVVAIKNNTLFTNTLVNVMRSRHGIRIIEVEESTFGAIELVKALDRNELAAVLGDTPFSERWEVKTLFCRPVRLPVGQVLLASADRATICSYSFAVCAPVPYP